MAFPKPSQPTFVLCALLAAATPCASFAQAPAPGVPAPANVLNKLWDEAAAAYAVPNYPLAAQKLEELLHSLGFWHFESTGRFLFGLRMSRKDFQLLESIDVRRSATGEPACPPLPIGEHVARGTYLRWTDEPRPLRRRPPPR